MLQFFRSLFTRKFDEQLSPNVYRFIIVCICWDTPCENNGLSHFKTSNMIMVKGDFPFKLLWGVLQFGGHLSKMISQGQNLMLEHSTNVPLGFAKKKFS